MGMTEQSQSTSKVSRKYLLALTVVFAVAACSDRGKQATTDSELAHDLALVNQTPATPEFNDTALSAPSDNRPAPRPTRTTTKAPAPAPRTTQRRVVPAAPQRVERAPTVQEPTPTPAPAPAATRARGFGSGTSFGLRTGAPICTTSLPGDKITATLTEAVTGDNGAYMPAGTTVVLEVASVTPGDNPESAQISLRVRSILLNDELVNMEGNVAIVSDLERHQIPGNKNSDRRKVVGGAVAGAIIGQIMGKDTKSTVIGAAAGAAAGTAAAAASRKYEACLPAGGSLRVTTSQPIILGA
jgi:glycine zipper 2TM protein